MQAVRDAPVAHKVKFSEMCYGHSFLAIGSTVQVRLHHGGIRSVLKGDLHTAFDVLPDQRGDSEIIFDKGECPNCSHQHSCNIMAIF